MEFSASYIPYSETGAFTTIVTDYVAGAAALRPFYVHRPDRAGIEAAIAERQGFATDRASLVAHLRRQYAALPPSEAVAQQIHLLQQPLTFTVCTAHQPNIFTGHLYFVYKIIHAIKLAQHLQTILPQYRFVPVYYMGSEDADLAELGEVQVNGIRYHWPTQQTGAVGRMKVDAALVGLIAELAGQLLVLPHGPETVQLLRDCYTVGTTIEQATFQLVHRLFGHQGLVVLLPDHTDLKRAMLPVFQDDLLHHTAEGLVAATSAQLAVHYKAQAYPRPINLFYLADGIRERIERSEGGYRVVNTDLSFTEAELLQLLQEHPAHFSPNVILRGLYQETVLPNVAFVGGGGELAYWLQLKEVFAHYRVPYPVQVLRNSFVVMPEEMAHKAAMLGLTDPALFASETALLNDWVLRENEAALSLANEQEVLITYYDQLGQKAAATDNTLHRHVMALQAKALQKIQDLEKKLMRAKKRQYEAERRHIHALKSTLFPSNRLQERVENVLPFLARYGNAFLTELHSYSPDLQQVMTILRKNG